MKSSLLVVALALLLLPSLASASSISLFTITGGYGPSFNGGFFGTAFQVNSPIVVTELGSWVGVGNTEAANTDVYLGEIGDSGDLASAVVPGGTVASSDGFAYESISPIEVAPGDYVITAQENNTIGWYHTQGFVNVPSEITLLGDSGWNGTSGTPADNVPGIANVVVGGSLQFEDAGSVPEPATLGLLGLGLTGLARKLRKRA